MYKMIILDLDGTLLNDYKKITKETIDLITRAYTKKGIITVIATGRPLEYVTNICEPYGKCFANYIIACNGAVIKNNETDEYIYENTFTDKEVETFRSFYLKEKADYILLYTDKETIVETKNNIDFKNLGTPATKVENMENVIKINPTLKKFLCLISGETSVLENIIKRVTVIDVLEQPVICNYLCKSNGQTFYRKYIDLVKRNCNKNNAIHILSNQLGIKQEEIIVMGDGGNDISMFECAGLKIAMANAEQYLKEKADFITTSNNDNGVAKAIKKFVFNE